MEKNHSFTRNPKSQITLVVLIGLVIYILLTILLGGVNGNQTAIIVDTFLFYFWLAFWHFFFSQFMLPVQTPIERWKAFIRLLHYLIGRHGPALLIENGNKRLRKSEADRHKPGVILVDTADAVMLRTDAEYTRPAGPGVIFTSARLWPRPNFEYLAGAVDLRPQTQRLGPEEKEDPFKPRREDEKEATFQERKKRRYETSGLTRNGIEAVPNIMVAFQLNTHPGLGGTQYGYNGYAVRIAITGEGIDPDLPADDARRSIGWDKLPAYLAANAWREALSLFTLDELFQELPPDYRLTAAPEEENLRDKTPPTETLVGLALINRWVKQRLTQEEIDELRFTGRPTGVRIPSPEFKVLKERGVRVSNVYITNLRFPAAVEGELVKRWDSTWYQHALVDRQELEKQLSDAKVRSQETARLDYALAIAQRLKKLSPGIEHSSDEILSEMVEGSLQMIVRDPQLQQRAGNERNALLDLIAWLQNSPSSQ